MKVIKYTIIFALILGITLYSFFLIIDYKNKMFVHRDDGKIVWISMFYIFMAILLYLVKYYYE